MDTSKVEKINNVCYCACHKAGKPKCSKCRNFHQSKEKPATHKDDISNPNY